MRNATECLSAGSSTKPGGPGDFVGLPSEFNISSGIAYLQLSHASMVAGSVSQYSSHSYEAIIPVRIILAACIGELFSGPLWCNLFCRVCDKPCAKD